VTLLTPFKHITTFKLTKLPIFGGGRRRQELELKPRDETANLDQRLDPEQGIGFIVEKTQRLARRKPATPLVAAIDPQSLPLTPQEVLQQIGSKLREWREYHHLSIDDISARTQIQPRLIGAIEQGHIDMLPESVYVKGMLKRYADNLGLDGTEIAQHMLPWEPAVEKFTAISRQTPGLTFAPQFKPLHIYLGYTLAICGIGAATSHLLNDNAKSTVTPTTTTTIQPQQAVAISPVTTPLPDVKIGIAVKSPTWAQIGIDGTTKVTGSLKIGTQFDWTAKKQVTISTNNAGGLFFSRDGQPLKPLGEIGEKQTVTIKVMK
jgi:transcriptional regulator with XRE-family HTH domain